MIPLKQNKLVFPLVQNPPQAKIFCQLLGKRRRGLVPLYHLPTLFLYKSKAVSSENIVLSQLSFKCFLAHSTRFSLCASVSIGVPVGTACLYPRFFKCIPIVVREMLSPSADNLIAKVRKETELSLRMYRSSSRDFATPIFLGRPLPFL